jgi:hypothetical protein
MGGEGYMTENDVERIFRDSRINLIVEGANEVMQSFIFAYGGKQLAEAMLGVQQAVGWDHQESPTANLARILRGLKRPSIMKAAAPLGAELYLGLRRAAPEMERMHESLRPCAERLGSMVREHSHQFKLASKRHGEHIIARQAVQARLADSAMWLHAWSCTLSKLDRDLRMKRSGIEFDRDNTAAIYFMDMAEREITDCFRRLVENDDDSMRAAAEASLKFADSLPNSAFAIPEKSPIAAGTGRTPDRTAIKQFPGNGSIPSPGAPGEGQGGGRMAEHAVPASSNGNGHPLDAR